MDTQGPFTSIAAFFREARVGGAARLSVEDSALVLSRFFQRYSFEACSADQLLALADVALRAKDLDVAREVLTRVLRMPDRVHLAYYKLGRLELAAGDPQAAVDRFTWGAEVDPGFAYNWMGKARALVALGKVAEAAEPAERFVGFDVRPHANEELGILADIADLLFEQGERKRAGPIYALLHRCGPPSRKIAVRLAESLIAEGAQADALAVLRPAHAAGALDAWGLRALAQCESQTGDHASAVTLAEAALLERPADPGFVNTWLEALLQAQRAAPARLPPWREAAARLEARLPPGSLAELHARAALAEGDPVAAAALLDSLDLQPHTRPFHLAVEVAYALLSTDAVAAAGSLADRLAAAAPGLSTPHVLQADIALRQQLWATAAAALQAIPAAEADAPHILVKWFEHACFVGDVPRATALQAQLEAAGLPSRQSTLPILRFLAEQQLWGAVVDRSCTWLAADFSYDQIGYVIFRAAKHTSRQADILGAITAVDGWADLPDLRRLHTALAWDAATTLSEMGAVAAAAGPHASPAMARRMAVQRALMARASAPPGRRALFLCADAPYLCATLVALHSALSHSTPGRDDCYLVVDDELAERTERLVAPFRERGFSVAVVPASTIVADPTPLHAAYGLFTSGHMLASAAYYRIYFAQYLQRLGIHQRAIYIDSDVLVRAPLDALFGADMAGRPLAARVETPRPEVSRAIALHGLDGDLYFNSGVLLFDLMNDQLSAALAGTVATIGDDATTLLFHDQCALNLGFRDRFLRLGTAWNTPVGEATRLADLPADTAVLHYLDRPKPWSAAYEGECGTLWLDAWQRTAEVIGDAEAVEVFGLNGV